MAANLSSMFAQLNNTIRQNPLAQRPDNTQAGMAERSVDRINPMLQGAMKGLTGAVGGDSAPLQTSKEAYGAGMEAIKSADLNTPEGLTQAAQVYQKLGMQEQALALIEKAQVLRAKQVAGLEEGGEAITKEAQRKRGMAEAMKNKDRAAYDAIKAGLLDPADYFEQGRETQSTLAEEAREEARARAKEKRDLGTYEAKKGIDEKYEDSQSPAGKWADDKGYESGTEEHRAAMDAYEAAQATSKKSAAQSVAMQKEQVETQANERLAETRASRALSLARELDKNPFGGGLPNTVETAFSDITGLRDKREALITAGTGLITSNAIRNLPVGPASDKDVALVLKGEPPMNASSETLASYARGVAKLAKAEGEYYRSKDRYMSRNGDVQKFGDTWELKTLKERKANTPGTQLARLAQNPDKIADFIEFYGYDPRTVDSQIAELEAYLNE